MHWLTWGEGNRRKTGRQGAQETAWGGPPLYPWLRDGRSSWRRVACPFSWVESPESCTTGRCAQGTTTGPFSHMHALSPLSSKKNGLTSIIQTRQEEDEDHETRQIKARTARTSRYQDGDVLKLVAPKPI